MDVTLGDLLNILMKRKEMSLGQIQLFFKSNPSRFDIWFLFWFNAHQDKAKKSMNWIIEKPTDYKKSIDNPHYFLKLFPLYEIFQDIIFFQSISIRYRYYIEILSRRKSNFDIVSMSYRCRQ